LLFDLLKAHPGLAPTTGYPDGEDHEGWIKHGGAVISGLATPRGDSGHVGYHFCLHMDATDVSDEVRNSMHRYYSAEVLGGRSGKQVLNKCPHLSNKLSYVRGIFPDACFIHIVREPVAVVASWINILKAVPDLLFYWPDTEYPCFWVLESRGARERGSCVQRESRFYPGGGLLRLADYWAAINENIPRQLAAAPGQLLTLYYEDLIARPEAELRRITDFCDIAPLDALSVPIERSRNTLRRPLLADSQVEAIRDRVRSVAVQFGYADNPE
jgi:hypothetical protein